MQHNEQVLCCLIATLMRNKIAIQYGQDKHETALDQLHILGQVVEEKRT